MARTGLRMMPTSPSSPLRFRTAGFPQYGSKAGLSVGAFPRGVQLSRRPSLHPTFVCPVSAPRFPHYVGEARTVAHRHSSDLVALPQGPSLRSGLYCPSPSSLNRPHAPHSRARHDFTVAAYTWRLRCACRPRRPASGSVLSLTVLCRHAALLDPGEPAGCLRPVPSPAALAFTRVRGVRRSQIPTIRFKWACVTRLIRFDLLRPVDLLASLADLTLSSSRWITHCPYAPGWEPSPHDRPTETFTPELSASRSPFSPSGMTTVATGQVPPAGLTPARTAASIAAPNTHTNTNTHTLCEA
jgi:hypothetical protein